VRLLDVTNNDTANPDSTHAEFVRDVRHILVRNRRLIQHFKQREIRRHSILRGELIDLTADHRLHAVSVFGGPTNSTKRQCGMHLPQPVRSSIGTTHREL